MPYEQKCPQEPHDAPHSPDCQCKGTGSIQQQTDQEREDEKRAFYIEQGKLSCVVCGLDIPDERIRRKAVTCCDDCRKTAEAIRRNKKTAGKRCRLCNRPASDQEMERWARFRKWEKENFPSERPMGRPRKKKPEAVLEANTAQPTNGLPSAEDLDRVAEEQAAASATGATK